MFGPVMLFYFGTIAVLGVMHILDDPSVILAMFNPLHIVQFFAGISSGPLSRWARWCSR